MKVTINDIAELAGVSKTTVSFAFNDPERIGEATRERILTIAEEHGYIPDPVARTMSSGNVGAIGLLVPQSIPATFANRHNTRILDGIGAACERYRNHLTLIPPMEGSLYHSVRNASVDGLVALGLIANEQAVRAIRQRRIPFVAIDGSQGDEVPSVGIDDRAAAAEIMRYVLSFGHRRIGIIGLGPEDGAAGRPTFESTGTQYSGIGELRLLGYDDALREVGLSLEDDRVLVRQTEADITFGETRARELLTSDQPPTVLVTSSDETALGVYRAAEELGLRIPEDVSVAGFDGIDEGAIVRPKLTTVHQSGYEKGERAAELLFGALSGDGAVPAPVTIRTELRAGGSVREPRDHVAASAGGTRDG